MKNIHENDVSFFFSWKEKWNTNSNNDYLKKKIFNWFFLLLKYAKIISNLIIKVNSPFIQVR